MEFDTQREYEALQQALAPGKMPIGLFLGAVCPLSVRVVDTLGNNPLIPDVRGLTEHVRTELTTDDRGRALLELVSAQLVADNIPATTIEDILSHVRALRRAAGSDKVR